MAKKDRTHYIKLAGIIALFGNLILCVIKLIFATLSESLAVMGDGIDSATDVLIAIVTIFIGKIISSPSDKEHPWGHGRAETIATMLLSFVIFFAGSQLFVSSIKQILNFKNLTLSDSNYLAILASLISILGKSFLAFSQFFLGKKSESSMILANAKNMKSDIFMSSAVLIGLGISNFFKMPILDPIVALFISLWVVKSAIEIFLDTNKELMDGNSDNELYKTLFEATMSIQGVSNPHRARIRKIASHYDIDLDIEVDANMTVHEAHKIAEKVENAIKVAISDVYDIMVHIEPAGHTKHHPKEQFGLNQNSIK